MKEKIHVIILNHGEFGQILIKSAELIYGEIENIESISLLNGVSIEEYYEKAKSSIQGISGDVILLTDIFGGTPNNVALLLQKEFDLKIICGINLPMLLELISAREQTEDVEKIIQQGYEAGKKGVLIPEKITIHEDELM